MCNFLDFEHRRLPYTKAIQNKILRRGRNLYDEFTTNLLLNLLVKKL